MFKLEDYDKKLKYKKNHDGSIEIYRDSPYNTFREHFIFEIKNQYIGSAKWIKNKLMKMDNQRTDIIGNIRVKNKRIRDEKQGTEEMTKEIVDYFATGGEIFVR